MAIQRYNITLEEKVVKKVRKKLVVGQKLSPVINQLLKEWVEKK